MAPALSLLPDHTKTNSKSENTKDEAWYAPCHQSTHPLASNASKVSYWPILCHYLDPCSAANTSSSLPIVAWCLFLFSLGLRIQDILRLPNPQSLLVETHLCQSARNFSLLAIELANLFLELVQSRLSDNE